MPPCSEGLGGNELEYHVVRHLPMAPLVVLALQQSILLVVVEELRDGLELDSYCKRDLLELAPLHHWPIEIVRWETPSELKNLLLLEREHSDPRPFLWHCWRPLEANISLLDAHLLQ